ncbi:MAG: flavodoxin domain-containing protein [Patescibacteria group bacterium]|jgi:menaquinone-dependent protoporphyrinogen IX oxidase
MKTTIFYFSKFGATKQYAEWIAEAVPGTKLVDAFNEAPDPSPYDAIIIATRAYMGRIAAVSYLKSNWKTLKDKKMYLLVVGMSPPEAEDSQRQYYNIPIKIRKKILGYSKVPGAIDLDKLSPIRRKLVQIFSQKVPVSKNMVAKEYITPVVEWMKKQVV